MPLQLQKREAEWEGVSALLACFINGPEANVTHSLPHASSDLATYGYAEGFHGER